MLRRSAARLGRGRANPNDEHMGKAFLGGSGFVVWSGMIMWGLWAVLPKEDPDPDYWD